MNSQGEVGIGNRRVDRRLNKKENISKGSKDINE